MATSGKKQYQDLVDRIVAANRPDVKVGKLGGISVLTWRGKAFMGFWRDDLVVRLFGVEHAKALALKGAKEYEVAGGAQMHGWVQVPMLHVGHWRGLAQDALVFAGERRD